MRDIVLVTGLEMPVVETETSLMLAALRARGVDAAIHTWREGESSQGRLVVVRSTWDYTLYRDEFIAWARDVDAVARLVNPVEVLEWNSHKRYLLDLAAAGVSAIPTTLLSRGASIADQRAALDQYQGEVVIKPAVSAGAQGTLRMAAGSAEATAHLAALIGWGDALIQPFEPAVASGEVSLLYFGGELSHAVRKLPAVGEFRVQAHYGGTVVRHKATAAERDVAAAALATAPGELAYARVDLVMTSGGPAIMELELVEPELFLPAEPDAPGRFADCLIGLLPAS